jgi:hypothetical protein
VRLGGVGPAEFKPNIERREECVPARDASSVLANRLAEVVGRPEGLTACPGLSNPGVEHPCDFAVVIFVPQLEKIPNRVHHDDVLGTGERAASKFIGGTAKPRHDAQVPPLAGGVREPLAP